jgi:GR25 family glycosyltransferase involved in LPS biosynthesis
MVIVTLAVLIFFEKRKRAPQGLVPAKLELLNNFDCYVINMAKNKNRLANFDREYKNSDLGSKPYIRWEAVNGFALGDRMKEIVSAKTWLGLNFLETTKKRVGDDQLTPGMIGCYQSHYGVWRSVQESGAPCAVIFEDDAKIYPTIYQNVIQKIPDIFPPDWDIILLGHWCKKCQRVNQFFGIPKYFWGLHGYMISQKGCEVMMKYREPEISVQIDHFMSLLSQKEVLKIFAVHPSYVVTSNFGTDLQLGVTRVE